MPVEQGFIVIGAQTITFLVTNLKTLASIERGSYPIGVGEDIFATGQIENDTVETMMTVLTTIHRLFTDDGVSAFTVVGSHSFFEAANASFVTDQVMSRLGLQIERATTAQESFYRIQAMHVSFPDFATITQTKTVLVDISSGSVELMAFDHGEFGFSRNLSLGPLRVEELMGELAHSVGNEAAIMQDFIDSRLLDFLRLQPSAGYPNVILMGSALSLFEALIPAGKPTVETDRAGFELLYHEAATVPAQALMRQYHMSAAQAAQVLPTMLLVNRLVHSLNAQRIFVAKLKLIDGLAVNTALVAGYNLDKVDPTKEILISAQNLAKRYQVDPLHQQATVTFALQLFDRLKKLHGLSKRERLLLQIAATVNDVGSFIDTHRHYAHSDYIISASALMGLTGTEQRMVATIAHFHSSDTPQLDLGDLVGFDTRQRLAIAKLSALLRVADSLDASRQQKIEKIRVSVQKEAVVLTATASKGVAFEQWTLTQKGAFFASVFGLAIQLKGKVVNE